VQDCLQSIERPYENMMAEFLANVHLAADEKSEENAEQTLPNSFGANAFAYFEVSDSLTH
jgi:CMP-N-acetylneuraminic acid synthetase